MKTKEKTRQPARSHIQEAKRLFPEMKESDMSSIDRKINALLIGENYQVTNTLRIIGGNNLKVHQMEYLRGERERVFVITHEPEME